ncbi:hypothetical protein TKK_0017639 [Trichogramma kaykai]
MYYMSRVSIFNLILYDLALRNGIFNVWNETVAQRGSNEIASILMSKLVQILETKPKIKEINTFSDNCGGQNKNQNVFSMMLVFAVLHNVCIFILKEIRCMRASNLTQNKRRLLLKSSGVKRCRHLAIKNHTSLTMLHRRR